MSRNVSDFLVSSVLKRYNYTLSVDAAMATISKSKGSYSTLLPVTIAATIMLLAGLVALFYGSLLFAGILLSVSAPLFYKTMSANAVANTGSQKIMLSTGAIEITTTKDETLKYWVNPNWVKGEIEKNDGISIGYILFEAHDGELYRLLDLFATEVNFLKDDVEIVTLFVQNILARKESQN